MMPLEGYASEEYYLHRILNALVGQGEAQSFIFDDESGALLTIDFVHHQVHEGLVFHGFHNSTSLGNNSSLNVVLTVGTTDAHIAFASQAGGDAWMYLFEAPSTSGGSALSLYNRNRTGIYAVKTTAVHSPSITNDGLNLSTVLIPGGTGPQASGDSARSEVEWILQPSTKYLLRLTNTSGQSQPACIHFDIYEL